MKKSKVSAILLFTILLTWGVIYLSIPAVSEIATLPSDVQNLYPSAEYYINGYDYSGNTYIPNSNDPQIGFAISNQQVRTIIVQFARPLEENIQTEVYYAFSGQQLSEERKLQITFEKGSTEYVIEMPFEKYTQIRLDINGSFSLKQVYVSASVPEMVLRRDTPSIWLFVFVGFCIFMLFELGIKVIPKIKRYWAERSQAQISQHLSVGEKRKKQIFQAVPAALILALLTEFLIWVMMPFQEGMVDLTKAEKLYPNALTNVNGYEEKAEDVFVPANEDPQLGFQFPEKEIQTFAVVFHEPLPDDTSVQVFYAASGESLSEKNSITVLANAGNILSVIPLPNGLYSQIRLDINGEFSLDSVYVSKASPELLRKRPVPNEKRFTVSFIIWLVVLCVFAMVWAELGEICLKNKSGIARFMPVFLAACFTGAAFLSYFALARNLPENLAPDEDMRNDIPFWMYAHGALPRGDEVELISNNVWGFSYGFTPCRLPAVLAWGIMKIVSIADASEASLLLASRLVSVFAAVGTVIVCFPIGKLLFHNWSSTFLFVSLIGFLPQVAFLGGYYNCDSLALFSSALIFYFLLSGRETHWQVSKCVGLAIAISCCTLTYYNAYGWILGSIIFCMISCWKDKTIAQKGKFFCSRALLVAIVVFLLTGWSFIYNAMQYDGNFMAAGLSKACAQNWEAQGHTVYRPVSPQQQGLSWWDMVTDGYWIPTTAKSFIAGFGYLTIFLPTHLYKIYAVILVVGILFAVYALFKEKSRDVLLSVFLIAEIGIPVLLSIIHSYTSGYQAQGRYVMPMLPALAVCVVYGYDRLTAYLKKYGRRYYFYAHTPTETEPTRSISFGFNPSGFAAAVWLILFFVVYTQVMIPMLF